MGPTPYPSEERAPVREQPSRTEPPDAVPEFGPDCGPGPTAPLPAAPGPRAPFTPFTPRARDGHDGHDEWPPRAARVRLGYGTGGGRSTLPREVAPTGDRAGGRRARPLDVRERTAGTPAPRTGVAIETTEDRA